MFRRLAPLYGFAWRALLVLLTAEVARSAAARYLIGSETPPDVIVENAFANPFLVIHVAAAMTALVIAPLQFVSAIRARWPGFHRLIGRLYLAVTGIGAPAGFVLALKPTAGPVAGLGFAAAAVLWPLFTGLGWRAAMARRLEAHRDWMLRSYAVLAGAITLRLMLPFSGLVLHAGFFEAYRVIAWLAWMTNLALVEAYIQGRRAGVAVHDRVLRAPS